jgi:hypothetical protein
MKSDRVVIVPSEIRSRRFQNVTTTPSTWFLSLLQVTRTVQAYLFISYNFNSSVNSMSVPRYLTSAISCIITEECLF